MKREQKNKNKIKSIAHNSDNRMKFHEDDSIIIKDSKYKLIKKPCIEVNTRELDRVLSTKYLSYIHQANSLCYTKSSLL